MKLNELKKEIPYKWRVGPGGTQLAYIDARDVEDLLDEVCGQEHWTDDYKLIDGKLFGGIGIEVEPNKWVWKWDCGVESNIEEEKGQVSDAFKRAGVKWGIGRFLYDLKPKKATYETYKSSAKKELEKIKAKPFGTRTSLDSYKEKAIEDELDDLTITDEMLGGEKEVSEISKCPVCGGRIGKKEIDYCKSKNIPVACFDCQKS